MTLSMDDGIVKNKESVEIPAISDFIFDCFSSTTSAKNTQCCTPVVSLMDTVPEFAPFECLLNDLDFYLSHRQLRQKIHQVIINTCLSFVEKSQVYLDE